MRADRFEGLDVPAQHAIANGVCERHVPIVARRKLRRLGLQVIQVVEQCFADRLGAHRSTNAYLRSSGFWLDVGVLAHALHDISNLRIHWTGCHEESGLYVVMRLAAASVSGPRSFSRTTPSSLTMNAVSYTHLRAH